MGVAYDLNALSGINAASSGLGVISNNLANSQSVGFKSSRAEFSDLFSGAQNSPGNGVRVDSITQDFSQGTITGTGRELDMAIDGEGFFVLEDVSGRYENIFTRNGSFKLDKDGFLTDQTGNKVQGFNLNSTLSTETNPVFDTSLASIDLDELNKTPKATDEMTFDINLNGEAETNFYAGGLNSGGTDDSSVGSDDSLQQLLYPESNAGPYQGFPDFTTKKTIYDSLGGEHTLNASYYKRDVVDVADSQTDANGAVLGAPGDPGAVKYTSWIVQYTVTDAEGNITGHLAGTDGNLLAPDGTGAQAAGQVYELRFDTNGNYMGAYQPIDYKDGISDPTTVTGAADQDPGSTAPVLNATDLSSGPGWVAVGTPTTGQPSLNFVIDSPLTGATDPLGGETTTPDNFQIALDFNDMTQFAGTNNLRGVTQNGYSTGDLIGLNTSLDGVIEARYSNGRSVPVAQLAMANFTDKNAMTKLGGQTYAESFSSGAVQLGTAQNSGFGSINAGSLEYSNVDVAGELVNMIQTQRTYQASAQVISTSQQLTQTILQL
ncbi:flagellar hook protein FlgE [Thiomicrorhabdus sp. 6S2-11]|uniref:Flagellar hook protein FlgE n=1 Tax=Thiomicrorhabdus marina TaxID=2818442 RepID=A0ABS3Q8P8_9GAMM|nr:flagellar hook protein FlgE [Thiomicrorhabdus marina]MBO1928448.1 flagellar hook protein FlgE [Thiomicrorhabdus marina]